MVTRHVEPRPSLRRHGTPVVFFGTCFALACFGCSTRTTRSAPAETSAHSAAEPRPSSSHSAAAFVLKGGFVFGVGRRNLLIDAGYVVAVDASDDAAERVVNVSGRYIVPGLSLIHISEPTRPY